ncbi:MAG: hypothetical protein Kow0079_16900 [Vicingaceae bacterium]
MINEINNISLKVEFYPFGMLSKNYESGYRYGFGGHEIIKEVYGNGNVVDMGDRWLDVRIGRTHKNDLKYFMYPSINPYSYAANNPLKFIDPDGQFLLDVHQRIAQKALKGFEIQFFRGNRFSLLANTLASQDFTDGIVGSGFFFSGGITYPDIKDFISDYNEKEHFDNMNFREIETNLNSIYNQMYKSVNSFKNNEIDIKELGFETGKYLHAIQDFYSHSNFIELYTEFYGKEKDLTTIPTLEEVLQEKKYAEFKEVLKSKLVTGKYPGEGKGSHKEINKDVGAGSKYTQIVKETRGKQVSYASKAAEAVATKASKNFLKKVKKQVEKNEK